MIIICLSINYWMFSFITFIRFIACNLTFMDFLYSSVYVTENTRRLNWFKCIWFKKINYAKLYVWHVASALNILIFIFVVIWAQQLFFGENKCLQNRRFIVTGNLFFWLSLSNNTFEKVLFLTLFVLQIDVSVKQCLLEEVNMPLFL